MPINGGDMVAALAEQGYYRSPGPVTFEDFQRYTQAIGEWKRPMELRTGGPNPVLESERGMTPHNDCNHYADCVVWYCRTADGAGDRTFLTDITDVIREIDSSDIEPLAKVGIHLPLHEVANTHVVRYLNGNLRFFWSFSAVRLERTTEMVERVQRVRRMINEIGERKRLQGGPIALEDGYFLLVNDHRFLHGRSPLPTGSRRHLFRCYLRLHDPVLREAELPV